MNDPRTWFENWECNTEQKYKAKLLMSAQCDEDIHACIQGFLQLCELVLIINTNMYVTPGITNSDVIENSFNQQRSTYNCANTNLSVLQ